jgi:hypothetical protein
MTKSEGKNQIQRPCWVGWGAINCAFGSVGTTKSSKLAKALSFGLPSASNIVAGGYTLKHKATKYKHTKIKGSHQPKK